MAEASRSNNISNSRTSFLAAAGAALGCGFGAMNLLRAFSKEDIQLRGMYSYWSATVGDAVTLPVLLGSLAAVSKPMRTSRWRIPGALAAAGTAAGVQASWLSDPTPQLNWTLPSPHTFTLAGWYHAGFMVAYSSAIGWLVGGIAPNLVHSTIQRGDRALLTVAAASALAFLSLVIIDNVAIANTLAARATLVGMGVAISVGVIVAVRAVRCR